MEAGTAEEPQITGELRGQLERIARALGLGGVGQHELRLRFRDGDLAWWEATRVRAPASALETAVRVD